MDRRPGRTLTARPHARSPRNRRWISVRRVRERLLHKCSLERYVRPDDGRHDAKPRAEPEACLALHLAEASSVSRISAYVDGNGSGSSSSQVIRFVICADNGGNPAALLGSTASHTIARKAPAGWVTLALATALPLKAGSYYLGIHSGSSSNVGRYASVQLGGGLKQNDNSFTSGATNPFGSDSTVDLGMSIYGVR